MVNKIAFNLPNENPLGGVIQIELSGDDLPAWIEAATWHNGRDVVPRRIDDERDNSDGGELLLGIDLVKNLYSQFLVRFCYINSLNLREP